MFFGGRYRSDDDIAEIVVVMEITGFESLLKFIRLKLCILPLLSMVTGLLLSRGTCVIILGWAGKYRIQIITQYGENIQQIITFSRFFDGVHLLDCFWFRASQHEHGCSKPTYITSYVWHLTDGHIRIKVHRICCGCIPL